MSATIHAFPTARIVRRPASTAARMTDADLKTLRQHWPAGWHEPAWTNDGVVFDQWVVPFDSFVDLPPKSIIALHPWGAWTRHDAFGRLLGSGMTLDEVV